jgi:hypothetical protein
MNSPRVKPGEHAPFWNPTPDGVEPPMTFATPTVRPLRGRVRIARFTPGYTGGYSR